jgi:hypothetical protein
VPVGAPLLLVAATMSCGLPVVDAVVPKLPLVETVPMPPLPLSANRRLPDGPCAIPPGHASLLGIV